MIKYANINKKYSKFDLQINELILDSPVTAILGHVGSGKTTLLKTLIKANNGTYTTISNPVVIFKPDVSQVPNNSINVLMGFYSCFYKFDKDKAKRLLRQFNIDLYTKYNKHSYGQKDIITIILTMCSEADLYILDEPFSRIDPINRKLLTNLLVDEINDESHILIASHELPNIERLVDYIYLLKDGEVISERHIDELENESSIKEWYREEYKKTSN